MYLGWLGRMSTPRSPHAPWNDAGGQFGTTVQWHLCGTMGNPARIPPSATTDASVSPGCSPSGHGTTGAPSLTDAEDIYAEHSRRRRLCLGAYRHQRQSCRLCARQATWRIPAAHRLSGVESPPRSGFVCQTEFSHALRLRLCVGL